MNRILTLAFALYGLSTLTSMAGMSVGAGLLALALAGVSLRDRGRMSGLPAALRAEVARPDSRFYLAASFGLAIACVVSLLAALVRPPVYAGAMSEVHFFKDAAKLWYLFWPFLLAPFLRRLPEDSRRTILRVWLVTFFVISILGVFQFFTGFPRAQVIPGHAPYFHAVLLFGHHLSTASIWIFPCFAALDLATDARGPERTGLARGFLWLSAALGLVVLFLTYSRMAWIATPLALLVWLLLRLPRKPALLVGLACFAALAGAYQVPGIRTRLNDPMGSMTRYQLWEANLTFFKDRPLNGVGWRHNQELSGPYLVDKLKSAEVFSGHAHNVVLDFLGGVGALGLAAWVIWMAAVMRPLWRARRTEAGFLANGFLCAWLAFLVNGLTQVNFWEAKVEHQMAWVVAWTLALATGSAARE